MLHKLTIKWTVFLFGILLCGLFFPRPSSLHAQSDDPFVHPKDGQTLTYGKWYMIQAREIPNATHHLVWMRQGDLKYENWADAQNWSNHLNVSPNDPKNGQFNINEPITVGVRGYVNGQWTEPYTISITLRGVVNLDRYSSTYAESEDFGSGSDEFSAVTYNHLNKNIVIADDEGKLFKYSTNADDPMIPIVSTENPMQSFTVEISKPTGDDVEGIAWMYGTTYAILDENNGNIHIVDLNDYENGIIRSAAHTILLNIPETGGKSGAEGIAFKFGSEKFDEENGDLRSAVFYVVKEKQSTVLYEVDWDISRVRAPEVENFSLRQVTINGLDDLSDVYYGAENGEVYIVSDDLQKVVQLGKIDWDAGSIGVAGKPSISLGSSYPQAEGLTFNADQSMMVVVSEKNRITFGRFTAP